MSRRFDDLIARLRIRAACVGTSSTISLEDEAADALASIAGENERLVLHKRRQAEDIMTLGALVYDASNPPVEWKARAEAAERGLAEAREALKPFAEIAEMVAKGHPGWDHDAFEFAVLAWIMTLAPFRRARAILSPSGKAKP